MRSMLSESGATPCLGLTSNGCSLSTLGKEARVTEHDAERKARSSSSSPPRSARGAIPPSVREIACAVGLASTSAVHHHLQTLERDGYLERGATQSRAIRLTPTAASRLGLTSQLVPQATTIDARIVPIIGEIAAGGPIEAYQDAAETMAMPDIVATEGDAYVLRVRGNSMVEAHIADGDYVVIRPQETARDGDIVVAQVEDNAVTLKRFFKEKNRIRLQPANEQYAPQFYDSVRIQGKLIGVIRQPGLAAAAGSADACVGGSARLAHARRVRSLPCSPPAFASAALTRRFSVSRRFSTGFPRASRPPGQVVDGVRG